MGLALLAGSGDFPASVAVSRQAGKETGAKGQGMEHEEWRQEAMKRPGSMEDFHWRQGAMEHEERMQEARGSVQKAGAKYRAQEAGWKEASKHLLLGAVSPRAFEPLLHLLHRVFLKRSNALLGFLSERWGEVEIGASTDNHQCTIPIAQLAVLSIDLHTP